MNQTLFDKIINIQLIKQDGTSDYITCPDSGMKPNIALRGSFDTASQASNIEVRITNFYPSVPLNQYKMMNITAGYRDSLQTTISAQIWVAHQESPSPDGITYFQAQIGDYIKWLNVALVSQYDVGTPFVNIFNDVAAALGLQPIAIDLETIMLTKPLSFSGMYVKDCLAYLNQCFPDIIIRMDSTFLLAAPKNSATTNIFPINYFSSPPQQQAYGWTFVAPWLPQLRPMDKVTINPKYFQQSFVTFQDSANFVPSAAGVVANRKFTVYKIEFEFETIGKSNSMSVGALTEGDKASPRGQAPVEAAVIQ